MPQRYANSRKIQRWGNSVGVTMPRDFLEEHGLLDEDGSLEEGAECEVVRTDDGGLKFEPRADSR